MLNRDLLVRLGALSPTAIVTVAGHGRLQAVTRAYAENGAEQVVLYVEDDGACAVPRGLPGDAPDMELEAVGAGAVPAVPPSKP